MTAHPLTIISNPPNAGEVGHQIYGRTKPLSVRVMEALYEESRQTQKELGFGTFNDLVNFALLLVKLLKDTKLVAELLAAHQPQQISELLAVQKLLEASADLNQESDPPQEEVSATSPEVIAEVLPKEEAEVTPTPKPALDNRDPLERFWEDRFVPWLIKLTGETFFETWFSQCRFLAVSSARCILEVPNQFFANHFEEHNYHEFITEALHELVGPEAFLKLEARPEPKEEPKPEPPKKEEKPLTKHEQRIAILQQLAYSTRIYAHYDATRKQLEAKWAEEDRAENPALRQPGDPQRQRQYHPGNKWDPDP